jgi:hypothetical protein
VTPSLAAAAAIPNNRTTQLEINAIHCTIVGQDDMHFKVSPFIIVTFCDTWD